VVNRGVVILSEAKDLCNPPAASQRLQVAWVYGPQKTRASG